MKKIIKHYPMTDRLIVRRGYIKIQKIREIFKIVSIGLKPTNTIFPTIIISSKNFTF
jgi:hypothetical protein